MAYKPCIPEIRSRYNSLTPAEKRLADYILQQPAETVELSASALADKASTASSAVIRLCHSLGFGGFSEFKMQLAVELSQEQELSYMPGIGPGDDSSTVLEKVFAANVKALQDSLKKLDRGVFDTVVDIIDRAEKIYIYGCGTSGGIASDLQYRLMSIGYTAFVFSDASNSRVSVLNITDRDAVIGISYSGRTSIIADTLKWANEIGAETVCISSFDGSPVTRVAKHVLTVYSEETAYPVEAVSARIAQMSVIDAITAALSARHHEAAVQRARDLHEALNIVRYGGREK